MNGQSFGAARTTAAIARARAQAHVDAAVDRAAHSVIDQVRARLEPGMTAANNGSFDANAVAQIPTIWRNATTADVIPALEAVFATAGARLIIAGEPIPGTWSIPQPIVHAYIERAANRMRGVGDELFGQARTAMKAGLELGETPLELAHRVYEAMGWDAPTAKLQAQLDVAIKQRDSAEAAFEKLIGAGRATHPPNAIRSYINSLSNARASQARQAWSTLSSARDTLKSAYTARDASAQPFLARARLVGRTETTRAYGAGQLAGASVRAQQTGVALDKTWLATEDARTREDHADADGQQVPIDQPFNVGGYDMQCPGDPDAPASEVCNCRCTSLFVRSSDD